jgi:hypothetical protein
MRERSLGEGGEKLVNVGHVTVFRWLEDQVGEIDFKLSSEIYQLQRPTGMSEFSGMKERRHTVTPEVCTTGARRRWLEVVR